VTDRQGRWDDELSRASPGDWDDLLSQFSHEPREEGWVTLGEASDATGVSRSTLRSWFRAGQIASKMMVGPHGPQRLVPLDAVVERSLASARGRRQLEHARSLEAEVESLRARVEVLERHLGLR
jgi:transposase